MFYFIITQASTYIEHYLWEWAEFETHINRIIVDVRSFSTTTFALTTAFASSNLCANPGQEPLPSTEGCGPNNMPQLPQKWGRSCSCPSPFQRDVGGLILAWWEELGMDKHEGGTQGVGGPCSMSRWQTTMKIVVRLCHSLTYPPTDISHPISVVTNSVTNGSQAPHAGIICDMNYIKTRRDQHWRREWQHDFRRLTPTMWTTRRIDSNERRIDNYKDGWINNEEEGGRDQQQGGGRRNCHGG